MQKRGQLTVFLILGVLILGLVFALSYFISSSSSASVETSLVQLDALTNKPLQEFMESCLDKSAREGLVLLGAQGGVFDPEFAQKFQQIPYFEYNRTIYYLEGKAVMPSEKEMEQQLAGYIEHDLPACFSEFEYFQQQGVHVEKGSEESLVVKANIGNEKVIINANYPITLVTESSQMSQDTFQVVIPIRLGDIVEAAEQVLEWQQRDGSRVCLTCIHDLSLESGLDISLHPHAEQANILLFSFDDPHETADNELLSYQFVFAGAYK